MVPNATDYNVRPVSRSEYRERCAGARLQRVENALGNAANWRVRLAEMILPTEDRGKGDEKGYLKKLGSSLLNGLNRAGEGAVNTMRSPF